MADVFTLLFSIAIILFAIGGLLQSRKAMKRNEALMRATFENLDRMRAFASDNPPDENEQPDQIMPTTQGYFMSSTMTVYPTGSSFEDSEVMTGEAKGTDEAIVVEEVPDKLIVETDRYDEIELEN